MRVRFQCRECEDPIVGYAGQIARCPSCGDLQDAPLLCECPAPMRDRWTCDDVARCEYCAGSIPMGWIDRYSGRATRPASVVQAPWATTLSPRWPARVVGGVPA